MSEPQIDILHNGGPDNETNCCICCGRKLPWSTEASDVNKAYWGDSCYDGCCACTTASAKLSFSLLDCKVRNSKKKVAPIRDCKRKTDTGDPGYLMEFTMNKGADQCYETQRFAVQGNAGTPYAVALQEEMDAKNISWQPPLGHDPSQLGTPKMGQTCGHQGLSHSPPSDPVHGAEYRDPTKKGNYPEAWGYSGTICKHDESDAPNRTPTRPGYSYPGECAGQQIIASLCCCKTGNYSKQKGGSDNLATCPPWPGAADGDRLIDECSISCYSFTIQPNNIYEHKYKVLNQKFPSDYYNCNDTTSGTDSCAVNWELVEKTGYSSCSPCVYKQGQCYKIQDPDTSQEYPCQGFNPDFMDMGLFNPLQKARSVGNFANPIANDTSTLWNGQHWLISGQCSDGKDHLDGAGGYGNRGEKKMILLVGGAYETNCDCQDGDYVWCNEHDRPDSTLSITQNTLCYSDELSAQCGSDDPRDPKVSGECANGDCLDWMMNYPDIGTRLWGWWPCGLEYSLGPQPADTPPLPYQKSPHACHNRRGLSRGQFGWPGDGIMSKQPAELDPAAWDTASYNNNKHPFGGKAEWFYGGPNKNGTNTEENTEPASIEDTWDPQPGEISEQYMWSRLYCAYDDEETKCGSLCESRDPVIMWYTGIIEEEEED